MKKLKLLLIILSAALLFSSCTKERGCWQCISIYLGNDTTICGPIPAGGIVTNCVKK